MVPQRPWVPESEPGVTRHEVSRQLDLAAAVGCRTADKRLRLRVPVAAVERAREALAWCGIEPGDRWAAVHVGASAPSRRYPPDLFAAAVDRGNDPQVGGRKAGFLG